MARVGLLPSFSHHRLSQQRKNQLVCKNEMTDDPVQTVARRLRLNQTFFMRNCFDVQTHNTLRDSGLMPKHFDSFETATGDGAISLSLLCISCVVIVFSPFVRFWP